MIYMYMYFGCKKNSRDDYFLTQSVSLLQIIFGLKSFNCLLLYKLS